MGSCETDYSNNVCRCKFTVTHLSTFTAIEASNDEAFAAVIALEQADSVTMAWKLSNWSACDKTCGSGTQTRTVQCTENDVAVADNKCTGTKPATSQACNTNACPEPSPSPSPVVEPSPSPSPVVEPSPSPS